MSKPKLLFYLKPGVLEIYSDQNEGSVNFVFSKEQVLHQEVVDNNNLIQSLTDFFQSLELKNLETIIFISAELLYIKQFPFEQTGVERSKVEEFIDSVPFDNAQISTIEISGENSLLVIAANRVLYQKIMEIVESFGAKVETVVPQIVFAQIQSPTLSPQAV